MDVKMEMPPPVNSLLSTLSSSQSLLLGREPPTDRESGPRAAISLLGADVKKLFGFVSAVAPEVRVASWTKSRPLSGSCETSCDVITWPRDEFVVSAASAFALTSTVVLTLAGDTVKFSSRDSFTSRLRLLASTAWKPDDSTRTVYPPTGSSGMR